MGPHRRCAGSGCRGCAWPAGSRTGRAACASRCAPPGRPRAPGGQQALAGGTMASQQRHVVAQRSPKPPGSMKSRCMSMMTSAVWRQREVERRTGWRPSDGRHGASAPWAPRMAHPCGARHLALAPGRRVVSKTMRPSLITTMRSASSSSSSRSSLTSSTAPPRCAHRPGGCGSRPPPQSPGRTPGWPTISTSMSPPARAPARRAARCRPTGCGWARVRPAS
jgi:hypothetical protein